MCCIFRGVKKVEHSRNMEHLLLVRPKDRAQKAPESDSACQDGPLLLLFAKYQGTLMDPHAAMHAF